MSAPSSPSPLVFLVGFMATGKTTVGRLLASALGARFVDLDDEIIGGTGRSVPEIFAAQGEAHFRALESEALARVIGRGAEAPLVVATGGGAAASGDNLDRMRAAGLAIALTVPLAEALERASGPDGDVASRPLLARPEAEVAALYRRRETFYRRAHARVPTEGRDPAAVRDACLAVVAVARALGPTALPDATIVALGDRTYAVEVSRATMGDLGARARALLPPRCRRIALISDETVAALYGGTAQAALERAGYSVHLAAVPPGETAKSFAHYESLCEALVGAGLDRTSAVVALGGGVVGDLAGFVAATLFRGLPVLQVPTTLLAMVDSAIGGKTGINLAAGKNLVGAFWQPRLVAVDPAVLVTLPARERRAAFGELVKYGLLDGEELYAAVDALAPWAAAGDGAPPPPGLGAVVRRCAAIKAWVVAGDEREQTGERALLNLGHTVGHAIEAAAGYGALLHGEAVALGLVAACRLSSHLGLCASGLAERVAATIRRAGLDAELDPWLRDEVLARVGVDKKRAGSSVDFVTLRGVGEPGTTPVELTELRRILRPQSPL